MMFLMSEEEYKATFILLLNVPTPPTNRCPVSGQRFYYRNIRLSLLRIFLDKQKWAEGA